MQFHAFAEQARRKHIILEQTVHAEENQDEKQMLIPAERRHQRMITAAVKARSWE
jgi:riboflavin synthase